MLRHFLLVLGVLITAVACDSAPDTAETAVLGKIKLLQSSGTLDYAAARKFFGVPLSTSGFFKAIANGDRITFRSGEYRGDDTPEFTNVSFKMEWRAEGFMTSGGLAGRERSEVVAQGVVPHKESLHYQGADGERARQREPRGNDGQ